MRAVTTQSLPAVDAPPLPRERMSWRRCKSLIASDLYRYDGAIDDDLADWRKGLSLEEQ